MKISSLSLNQFRKFDRPVKVDGMSERLNLIVGPNEMGKSTLLAALRAAFFFRYMSKAKDVKDLQHSHNKAAPVVRVCFEMQPGEEFSITKRFISRPYAQLTCPDGKLLEGDAAEEELRRLLVGQNASTPPATAGNAGMWNVLWVKQGESSAPVNLSEDERSVLRATLESQVGDVLGGKRGESVPRKLAADRLKLVTKTSKPTGEYRELKQRLGDLEQEVIRLNDSKKALSDLFEKLENARSRLHALDPKEDERIRKELDEVGQTLQEIELRDSKLAAARNKLEQLSAEHRQLEQEKARVQKLSQERIAFRERLEAVNQNLDSLKQDLNRCKSQTEKLRMELEGFKSVARELNEKLDDAKSALEAVHLDREIKNLTAHLADEKNRMQQIATCQRQINENPVSAKLIEQIKEADRDLKIADSQISASATRLKIDLIKGQKDVISFNGKHLESENETMELLTRATVSIEDIGSFTIDPVVENSEELLSNQIVKRKVLERLLASAGASSVNQAQQTHRKRQACLQQVELLSDRLEQLRRNVEVPKANGQSLHERVKELKHHLADIQKQLGFVEIQSEEKAKSVISEVTIRIDTNKDKQQAVDASLDQRKDEFHQINLRLAKVEKDKEHCEEKVASLDDELTALSGLMNEDERKNKIDALSNDIEWQQGEVDRLKGEFDPDEKQMLEQRMERLNKALENRCSLRQQFELETARSTAAIEAIQGEGIDEEVRIKIAELERVKKELSRIEHEVELLDLLLGVLRDSEQEVKEKFLAPILQRVRPYLMTLFASANVTIDKDFNVVKLERHQGFEETLDQLSIGTQEQIAVLIRLAFAEMLSDENIPATVILDDALVYSDDQRIELLFDILNKASNKIQIIVLTCRETLFQRLGGNILKLEEVQDELLRSA